VFDNHILHSLGRFKAAFGKQQKFYNLYNDNFSLNQALSVGRRSHWCPLREEKGQNTPCCIGEHDLPQYAMHGSIVIDVSIDQGGCIEDLTNDDSSKAPCLFGIMI